MQCIVGSTARAGPEERCRVYTSVWDRPQQNTWPPHSNRCSGSRALGTNLCGAVNPYKKSKYCLYCKAVSILVLIFWLPRQLILYIIISMAMKLHVYRTRRMFYLISLNHVSKSSKLKLFCYKLHIVVCWLALWKSKFFVKQCGALSFY